LIRPPLTDDGIISRVISPWVKLMGQKRHQLPNSAFDGLTLIKIKAGWKNLKMKERNAVTRYHFVIATMITGLLLQACAGAHSNSTATMPAGALVTPGLFKKITGIEWQLTKMTLDNKLIDLVADSKTTFACDDNGRVSGVATLNRYSGNLKLLPDGEVVWNKAFIMTRMAGPPELMQQEANFTQALMQTSRMFLNESKLALRSRDNSTVLEFERAE